MCMSLMAAFLFGNVAMASDYVGTGDFAFNLGSEGKLTISNSTVEKTNSNSYVIFNITTCQNTTGYPCYLAARSVDGNNKASSTAYVYGQGTLTASYLPNYGYEGNSYRIALQTSKNASCGATLIGTWTP